MTVTWGLAEWCSFRGVGHAAGWVVGGDVVVAVHGDVALDAWPTRDAPAPTAEAPHGAIPFALAFRLPEGVGLDAVTLTAKRGDQVVGTLADPVAAGLGEDPYHALWPRFVGALRERPVGRLLEIGSRGERASRTRAELPDGWDYVGVDVHPGPNVDVVADAHDLRAALGRRERFDAVIAFSVFEHLAMPWKAVLAIHEVLQDDGLVLVETHQSFPLHEVPWDYWRYSNDAWFALFNPATGFAIDAVAMGEPASIVPRFEHPVVTGVPDGQAYLGAGVIARRIGRTRLRWDVGLGDITTTSYPS